MQDEALAKADLRDQERLEAMRSPWEASFREIDDRFPIGAGGFDSQTKGTIRGHRNFDSTHILAHQRFAAAGVAMTTPEEKEYIKPFFLDPELQKLRSVQLWCSSAGRRLQAIRHASHTGFGIAVNEDWDQLGRYGTSAVWQEAGPRGLVYRCLHLAEVWIDVDFAGMVDRVHRKFELTARQAEQMFGEEKLTPKMREALAQPGKEHTKFEFLHVVAQNTAFDADRLDWRSMPIVSRVLAMDEKIYVRRRGFHTMPVSVSRNRTSAGEIYGRSPAFDVSPDINGLNAMKHTALRATHKAVDPALAFNNDDGITRLSTKPGGLNPGMVDDNGRLKVQRVPGGENGIPYTLEMMQDDRSTIRAAFLEDFYKILTDPNSRMTTTEVLEVMAKQGVLVRPFASRYATEKQYPMSNRDLDLALRAGQIDPLPPEVREAGAWPLIDYENPLAAMARAESTAKSLRFVQALPALADIDPKVRLRVNAEAMAIGMAQEIGVRPEYIRDDEEVAALLEDEKAKEEAVLNAEQLEKTAGAVKDFAQAEAIVGGA